ncbi:MAG: hypothetical protein KKC53_04710, partial [Actinobacteria bacterium]|nr:hypothetical protein [Actinomycetota bacterium]
EDIGFNQFQYADGVTVIEWGNKMKELLAFDHLQVNFDYYENKKRKIKIVPNGKSWEKRLNKIRLII